jgi:hypothetical protein
LKTKKGDDINMGKWKVNNRIVSGTELVRLANREFTIDSQGRGKYGRPHTADGAYLFLKSAKKNRKYKYNVCWWNSKTKKWIE